MSKSGRDTRGRTGALSSPAHLGIVEPAEALDARVTLHDVRKRFGRRMPWVLDGVDLSIAEASSVTIVGANGSGKSTLLRLISRLSTVTSGHVTVRYETVAFAPERLPDQLRMSVGEYLGHMSRLRHIDRATTWRSFSDLRNRLQFEPPAGTPIRNLSKGNSQKVALIQALMIPVDLVVLDEPDSGLDSASRLALDEIIRHRVTQGSSVVIASHRANDHVTDRTFEVINGKVVPRAIPIGRRDCTRILLSLVAGEAAKILRGTPGLIDLSLVEYGSCTATVEADSTDRFLFVALTNGCSVRSVGAIAPGSPT